jgi:hypothetical protein
MKMPVASEEAIRVIEAFEGLPLKRRVEIFRDLTPEAREELVQSMSRPGEIVRRCSEEEIYFTIKALGVDRAPGLVALTTGRQLIHLLDMDLWKRGILDPESASRWIQMLARIGREKILHMIQVVDPELVLSALQNLISVAARDPDVDRLEESDQVPEFTLDDTYYIEFAGSLHEEPIKIFLGSVFEYDPEYYFSLMQELVSTSKLESEDIALRFRNARLADKGFPDFDEAMEIYRYVKKDSLSMDQRGFAPRDEETEAPQTLLVYPFKALKDDSLLKQTLDRIDDPDEVHSLALQLAHLGNKVMVADAKDPGSLEELQKSLEKVEGYINIALEERCGRDLDLAVNLVASNHVELLFRRGYSRILELRGEAEAFVQKLGEEIGNLGYPMALVIKSLLQKRPLFAGDQSRDHEPREFESLSDIRYVRSILDRDSFEDRWETL